ncbi:SphA family protein [Denitromonas iodatirespirans]|uniref:Transporter n=1 Tax=Denitromonas iodatirespirans TaxID=2795389 RepID=A0A944HA32_DENI1|nr:transporter [Denitromonas iodatirespirans]MBT0963864.1 transporter [Denitromonas iodatirespirans]
MTIHSKHPRAVSRIFLGIGLSALAATAAAVEGGAPITPFGIYDFGAGIAPPPSPVAAIGVRANFYQADQIRDNDGKRSPVDTTLRANSFGVAVLKMTDTKIFGANYGFSVVVPVLDMNLDLGIPTPGGTVKLSDSNAAQGDITVTPVMLQWVSPGLFQLASLQIQAPTGYYRKDNLINPGTNHWTISPTYAFTYITQGGFEVSSNIQLNFHTRNNDTNYRSGVEYQHEFAVGQHVGPFTLGVGGYYYQQITDDDAQGLTNGNRARVAALGPALSFFSPGALVPTFWVHAYREFGARNRAQGSLITLRAAWTF